MTEAESRIRIVSRAWLMIGAVAIAVVIIDQLAKIAVMSRLSPNQVIPVIPGFFNLTLRFNPGAAFGLLSGLPPKLRGAALGLTTIFALSCVVYFLMKDYFGDRIGQISLALILGGAFGNIIDRLCYGEVVDFLDFHLFNLHWPAFNVADSAICVGVFILLIRYPRHSAPPEGESPVN